MGDNMREDTTKITSFDTLHQHLFEAEGTYSKSSMAAYFYKHAFTGSSFERLRGTDHNRISADDIVAVSMLSVEIPPSVSRWILGEGSEAISTSLRQIQPELTISSPDANLSKNSDAWQLWKLLHDRWGLGETKTSKLLACKRPLLFPIYDQHVAMALGINENDYWKPWQDFMRSEKGIESAHQVAQFAEELNITGISDLRLLDVVVWMREHGHTFITQEYCELGYMIPVEYASPRPRANGRKK